MDLKKVLCSAFTDKTIQFLQTKIQDHRRLLQEVFPDFTLRPKHHYIEHYPDLICCFGPLVHLWTMRFEGKHCFFKRIVHDTQHIKNVLKTLANRHQHILAYYLSALTFFKPHQQTSNVSSVMLSVLPDDAKAYIEQIRDSNMIYSTSKVNIDGTDYDVEIEHKSYYIEHLRSYELSPGNLTVDTVSELNDKSTLSAYNTVLRTEGAGGPKCRQRRQELGVQEQGLM
ncbi:hypothetical protein N1851_006856 [Merluccius polli]|uniref:Uncharacterized protein n=1 Tax=Merluccius polli TaxID=89951 RepID=A0AA47P5R2_MERPO|nr:hypothetical protein N1851_006856 [Merluccius polli]